MSTDYLEASLHLVQLPKAIGWSDDIQRRSGWQKATLKQQDSSLPGSRAQCERRRRDIGMCVHCAILFISMDGVAQQTKSVALAMRQPPLWPICLNLPVIGDCNTRCCSHSIQKLTPCTLSSFSEVCEHHSQRGFLPSPLHLLVRGLVEQDALLVRPIALPLPLHLPVHPHSHLDSFLRLLRHHDAIS